MSKHNYIEVEPKAIISMGEAKSTIRKMGARAVQKKDLDKGNI